MKFSLTITDATKEEIEQLLSSVSSGAINTSNGYAITPAAGVHGAASGTHSTDAGDDDNGPQDMTAPQFDASGLPWDARIHSANKSRTTEGNWRGKRGVTAAERNAVEAQLRQQAGQNSSMYMQQSQPGQQVQQQQPQVTGVMNPQPGQQQMQMPQGQPPQQYQQQPQPGPQMQQQPMPMGGQHMQMPQGQPQQYQQQPAQQMQQQQPLDAQGFMTHLSNQMQAKMQDGVTPMIEQNYLANALPRINQLLAQNGIVTMNAITDVLSNPAAIPFAVMVLQQDGRW